jgi:glycine cleavage system P protein (glycine dehydrogenase) subunit 1
LPYVLNTPADVAAMLQAIGAKSIDELFAPIPPDVRLDRPLDIPAAMGEVELAQHVAALAKKNRAAGEAVCFLGGGSYDHFIPTVVDAIAGRSEYYTAYTPYQAEASQGSLQAFFEYQTLICQLTGMDVANASLYEGGSAVAEAVLMAIHVTDRKGDVVVPATVHPEYRQVLATYLTNLKVKLVTLPCPGGFLNPDDLKKTVTDQTAAVVVQHPNFFGHLEEAAEVSRIAHAKGALAVASFDPISTGVLKRPGEYGADIAVAEGQCLGTPMGYGGPYLGVMTCRSEYVRKIPGRLVGQTTDRNGKRCWVLTLQTREQHIRRATATSNICTNQGLFALRATVYLGALGPQGLKETAELCLRKAHYAAEELAKVPGVSMRFDRPFFKEFAIRLPGDVSGLLKKLQAQGYFAGLHAGRWYPHLVDTLTVAVTEKRTKAEIDGLAAALRAAIG